MNTTDHYNLDEWTEYYYNITEDCIREQMEEHLLHCDRCMDCYLSVVEDDKSIDSIEIPSFNFTHDVMAKLQKKEAQQKMNNRKQLKKIMFYYVSAASISIVLTASGLFSRINSSIPKVSATAINAKAYSRILAHSGWSERLTNATSNMIDSIVPNRKN